MLFENIAGHTIAKRALEIAAVGNHSLILIGPKGVGKTALVTAYQDTFESLATHIQTMTGAINYKFKLGTKCRKCGEEFIDGDIARRTADGFRHEMCPAHTHNK